MNESLWRKIVGHQSVLPRLINAIEQQQVSHAYLFVGPNGIGKHFVATVFAAALNCETKERKEDESPCGSCRSCRSILRKSHQDVHFIQPEGNFITIEQVRDIRHQVQLKNVSATSKAVIIDNAGAMTLPAANSLLKTLEEPPGSVVFILVASNLESLPSTIISRCQLVTFLPLTEVEVEKYLVDKYSLNNESAKFIARFSRGILADAVAAASDDTFLERRRLIAQTISRLNSAGPALLSTMTENLIQEIKSITAAAKERQQSEYDDLELRAADNTHLERMRKQLTQRHKRELARLERRGFNDILDCLNSYYRDALLLATGGDRDLIANIDIADLINTGGDIDIAHSIAALSHIKEAKYRLSSNVSPALMLETLFFSLQEVQ